MIIIPSYTKIASGIKELIGRIFIERKTHRLNGDLIRQILFSLNTKIE
jgi:hypothetical protein